jgi:hypothetical protein
MWMRKIRSVLFDHVHDGTVMAEPQAQSVLYIDLDDRNLYSCMSSLMSVFKPVGCRVNNMPGLIQTKTYNKIPYKFEVILRLR